MPVYTVFWKCGDASEGTQVAIAPDPQSLCERMVDRLPTFLGGDEQAVRDRLTVTIFQGAHAKRPNGEAAYEITP